MCGIAGFSGDVDPEVLVRMEHALAHRGPDDAGTATYVTSSSHVGFANRRLAILDLTAAGHQPMTVRCPACGSADGPDHEKVWLTFNGEIYNFPELRSELERAGHQFASHSDSEVILHLYVAAGPEMLQRLNGIFALAIYDGRPRGQRSGVRPRDVLLARDGIGVKPLYYAESRGRVLFASEIKVLLECDRDVVDRRLDPIAINQFLAYQWVPAPRTVLQAVRKVLPGELLILRDGAIASRSTFYRLPTPVDRSREPLHRLVEQFQDEFRAAVSRQLLADVPVGAFLSGGLDSSAVVAMVRQARPSYRIPCYSMAFAEDFALEGGVPSDFPFAVQAARHLNVELIPVEAGPAMVQRLEDVLYSLDEPTGDPAPINAYLIAERARADGVKVLLSGTGGDDLLGGYGRHLWLSLERFWDAAPGALRKPVATMARRISDAGMGSSKPRSFAGKRLLKLLSTVDAPAQRRLISRFHGMPAALRRTLLDDSVRASVDDAEFAPLLNTLATLPPGTDPLTMMLQLEQRHFLADHNLNYLDKTTMAFGVEARVPLLDLELVAFAATIPSRYKVRGLTGKYLFKKAMEPYLPRDIIYRRKSGFGVPLRRWMATDLREVVRDTLSSQSARARGVFNPAAVQNLIDRTDAGDPDAAYPLFSIFAFETWSRRFLDRDTKHAHVMQTAPVSAGRHQPRLM
jgi:asparagine synthase (glutamine-hydrolysing)